MPRIPALAIALCLVASAAAGDWPQWLGPNRDNSSTEKVAPWKAAPTAAWRMAVGAGHSSPVVVGGRVYIHAKVEGKDAEEIIALDAKTGKEAWRTSYPRAAFMSQFGNGPGGTPAVVGKHLFAFGVTGVLTCIETEKGAIVWQIDTLKEFKAPNLTFGMNGSPLIDGDRVVVMVGGKGASIVAFDKNKGTVLWKALDDGASYSSPIAIGEGDKREIICLTGDGLVSLKPADGSLLWRYPFKDLLAEASATPVKMGDRLLASAITIGSACLKLESKEGKPAVAELWKNPALNSYFTTPISVGSDHFFMVTGNPLARTATLHCVDVRTGKATWSKPKVGRFAATLLRTGDGKVLMLTDTGELALLKPDTKEYKELCRAKVCGNTWVHPALCDGMLYVRDNKELICLKMP